MTAIPQEKLAEILKQAKREGGNVIIPAFAVGRTQELLYFLREIFEKQRPRHAGVRGQPAGLAGPPRSSASIPRRSTRKPGSW